jgi:hypothetical protein
VQRFTEAVQDAETLAVAAHAADAVADLPPAARQSIR